MKQIYDTMSLTVKIESTVTFLRKKIFFLDFRSVQTVYQWFFEVYLSPQTEVLVLNLTLQM